MTNYITDAVRAVIGARSDWSEATNATEASEVRRFFQAIIDPKAIYWDDAAGKASRYGGTIAPPAYAVHAFRRAPEELADPLDAGLDPDFDGVSRALRPGLPKIPVPLHGILNGGYEYELFSYARVGSRIKCRSAYRDVYQRDGKNGPIVFVLIEDEYATVEGRPLLKSLNTMIMR